MNLLYFGDLHNRVTAPENRTDDFEESMFLKRQEIVQLGNKYSVEAYLQPGDFFDIPNPALDYTANVIEQFLNIKVFDSLQKTMMFDNYMRNILVKGVWEKVENGELTDIDEIREELHKADFQDFMEKNALDDLQNFKPLIGIAGNHELYGNNIKTLPKTMIGFMEKLGLLKFATKENPIFFQTEDGLKVAITGTHYHLDIDTPEHLDDYVVEEKLGDIHIHVVHGFLTDKSKGTKIRHTLIDHIKHTKADLTITGHDHIGFPITEVDGKYFVNSGGIARLTNDVKEIARKPKVLLISITKASGLQLKEIYLKSAKDGNLVLDRKKITEKNAQEEKFEEFKKSIRDAELKKSTSISEIICDIADNDKLPEELKQSVIDKVSHKMMIMDKIANGVLPDVTIDKLILENVMSHEYSEITLSKRFNVFVGESRQGKSTIFRAMDLILNGKTKKVNRKAIIRKGADYAKVTVFASNGYVISRYLERKETGKNGYYITDPLTGETNFHNTKILPEVQRILGYSTIYIDKDLQVDINFLKQGDSWFLIGNSYSGPDRAKIIGGIYGTQYADAVIRDVDAEEKRINGEIKGKTNLLKKTEEQIEDYAYLEELKASIDTLELTLREIEELEQRKMSITILLQEREALISNIKEADELLIQFDFVEDAKKTLNDIVTLQIRYELLNNLIAKRDECYVFYVNSCKVLKRLIGIPAWRKLFEDIVRQNERRNSLDAIISKKEELLVNVESEDNVIKATEYLDGLKEEYDSLLLLNGRKQRLDELIRSRDTLIHDIKVQEEIIRETSHIDDVKDLLVEMKSSILKKQNLKEKIERAIYLEEEIKKGKKCIEYCDYMINQTNFLETNGETTQQIKDLMVRRDKISSVITERDRLVGDIKKSDEIVEKQTQQINCDIEIYQKALESVGKCPVCFGTIDKATINRIISEHKK